MLYPDSPGYPEGTYNDNGELEDPDEDGGIDRLRRRLGSISCFMSEFKKSFSCWYNNRNGRKGYFWSDRFKSLVISLDEAQLICSAYIDLNPVRANIVKRPEDYRWSSLGLRTTSRREAAEFLYPLALCQKQYDMDIIQAQESPFVKKGLSLLVLGKEADDNFSLYREFVYKTGAVRKEGAASISAELVKEVEAYHGKLGIGDRFRYKVKNISEGLAFGSYELIESLQALWKRKYIRPRSFMEQGKGDTTWSFTTRVLRL